jgi:tRNA 2-thiouridine synthesizing protein A
VPTTASHPTAHESLDARGLVCPEPLMLARNRLRAMTSGEVLEVTATDPSTVRDFTNLCRFMGHTLLDRQEADGEFRFWIRKA